MTTYARANRTVQWYGDKFSSASFKPNCGVLHTTEGFTWPGYDGGAKAPNYTGKPNFATQRIDWRAHFEDEESSRALQNQPGGVETNTAAAIQVELIGTCDPKNAKTWAGKVAGKDYIYWPEAPQWALKGLADFIADMNKRHGIKISSGNLRWVAYPQSANPATWDRMSFAEWRAFYGWCGHQHVPENVHGDPGNFPWAQVATYAKAIVSPPSPSKPTLPEVPVAAPTVNEIWGADIIDAPVKTDSNPFWTPASYLIWIFRGITDVKKTLESLKDINSKQDQILAKQDEILAILKGPQA